MASGGPGIFMDAPTQERIELEKARADLKTFKIVSPLLAICAISAMVYIAVDSKEDKARAVIHTDLVAIAQVFVESERGHGKTGHTLVVCDDGTAELASPTNFNAGRCHYYPIFEHLVEFD